MSAYQDIIDRACKPVVGDKFTRGGMSSEIIEIDEDLIIYRIAKGGALTELQTGKGRYAEIAERTIHNGAKFIPAETSPETSLDGRSA